MKISHFDMELDGYDVFTREGLDLIIFSAKVSYKCAIVQM